MADVLKTYLGSAGRSPFAWAECDCYLFVADWVERVTGVDPAGEYRGAYTTSREARNIIRQHGGPLVFADALLARAGCERIIASVADVGDVALVQVALKVIANKNKVIMVPVGAIKVKDGLWAVKTTGATLTIGDFAVLRAWAVPRHG